MSRDHGPTPFTSAEGVDRCSPAAGGGGCVECSDPLAGVALPEGALSSDRMASPARPNTLRRGWWDRLEIASLVVAAVAVVAGWVFQELTNIPLVPIVLFVLAIGLRAPALGLSLVRSVQRRSMNFGLLVVVGTVGALLLGLLEEAAALVVIYSWAGVFEERAIRRTQHALEDLMQRVPDRAVRLDRISESTVPVSEIRIGQSVRIRAGVQVPLDGVVVSGTSSVDESAMTGESTPVDKGPGDTVLAGTVNLNGALDVRVTTELKDTTLAQVVRVILQTRRNRSSFERFSERFGGVYTQAMFAAAVLTALLPPLLLGWPWSIWAYRALVLLVISCSCGLLLSVPAATLSAITSGARRGLVVKGGAYLEAAGRIDTIAFDKTGTLTTGRLELRKVAPLPGHTEREILQVALSVEGGSQHPLARAIVRSAQGAGGLPTLSTGFMEVPGRGSTALIAEERFWVGNPNWATEEHVPGLPHAVVDALEGSGHTTVLVWNTKGVLGVLGLRDTPRPGVAESITRLRRMGVRRFLMLSGDSPRVADALGRELGITEVHSRLLPAQKIAILQRLQGEGHRVAMVGDGINDGPALAQADLGIAMGLRGTDLAKETADVVIVDDDLGKIADVLDLGRSATATLRQNIVISLLLVGSLVTAGLLGLVGLVSGILLNEAGAVAVVLNGLRMASRGGPSASGHLQGGVTAVPGPVRSA